MEVRVQLSPGGCVGFSRGDQKRDPTNVVNLWGVREDSGLAEAKGTLRKVPGSVGS